MKGLGFTSASSDPYDRLKRIERRQKREAEREKSGKPPRQRRPKEYTPEEDAELDRLLNARRYEEKFKDGQRLHGKAAKGRSSYANDRAMQGRPIREGQAYKYRRAMEDIAARRPNLQEEQNKAHDAAQKKGCLGKTLHGAPCPVYFDTDAMEQKDRDWASNSYQELRRKGYSHDEAFDMMERIKRGVTR